MTHVETLEDVSSKIEDTNGQYDFDQLCDVVFWNNRSSQYDETLISDLLGEQAPRFLDELKARSKPKAPF